MRAIAIRPGTTEIDLVEIPEPLFERPDQVLIRVLRTGVCGTDREIADGLIGMAPPGEERLVIGHEMLGRVAAVGTDVTGLSEGDLVVATVRRGCGRCSCCNAGHSDFCTSGDYIEHGIKQLHGFMAEYVVDSASDIVRLPEELEPVGVLLEPLSVSEKAIEQALRIFQRLPCPPQQSGLPMSDPRWGEGLRTLVAGSGPIGMLAALILRAHGAEVTVVDLSDEEALSSRLLRRIGARHLNGRSVPADQIDETIGQIDLIVEATGVAQFSFNLIDALGVNGVYAMTGIPGESQDVPLPAGAIMQQLVLQNQVVFGSVNASRGNFEQGIADLARFQQLWPGVAEELITQRVPMERFREAIEFRGKDVIKAVIEIAS